MRNIGNIFVLRIQREERIRRELVALLHDTPVKSVLPVARVLFSDRTDMMRSADI
jgi:hypothetical protein